MFENDCKYYDESAFNDVVANENSNLNYFSLMHFNIRSKQKKFHSFDQYLQCIKHKFSIIGISETWHSINTCDLYPIEGYQCVHSYRQSKKGGGVTMYVDDKIQFQVRPDLEVRDSDIDSVFIEFDGKQIGLGRKVIVGTIYRPPNTNMRQFNVNLTDLLDSLKTERKTCYLLGDFNINLINCGSHVDTKDFLNNMFSHSFYPVISKPTRITEYSATLIDNIFCNLQSVSKETYNGLIYTDISDHLHIFTIAYIA